MGNLRRSRRLVERKKEVPFLCIQTQQIAAGKLNKQMTLKSRQAASAHAGVLWSFS
jgi:hypothetical protein